MISKIEMADDVAETARIAKRVNFIKTVRDTLGVTLAESASLHTYYEGDLDLALAEGRASLTMRARAQLKSNLSVKAHMVTGPDGESRIERNWPQAELDRMTSLGFVVEELVLKSDADSLFGLIAAAQGPNYMDANPIGLTPLQKDIRLAQTRVHDLLHNRNGQ
jgi:hypothetical protein